MVYYHDTSRSCRAGPDDVMRKRMTTVVVILAELFPLDCFRNNFVSVPELEYPMVYYHDTLQLQ